VEQERESLRRRNEMIEMEKDLRREKLMRAAEEMAAEQEVDAA
jgi:hypothetical protein